MCQFLDDALTMYRTSEDFGPACTAARHITQYLPTVLATLSAGQWRGCGGDGVAYIDGFVQCLNPVVAPSTAFAVPQFAVIRKHPLIAAIAGKISHGGGGGGGVVVITGVPIVTLILSRSQSSGKPKS